MTNLNHDSHSLNEVFFKLGRIESNQVEMFKQLEHLTTQVDQGCKDIQSLQNYKSKVAGVAAAVGALSAVGLKLLLGG
jgi:hypothetical protein